jgi:alpha-L-arabinofuranosidase
VLIAGAVACVPPVRPARLLSLQVTDGVGLYELLTLVELMGSQPQVSVYTGVSACFRRRQGAQAGSLIPFLCFCCGSRTGYSMGQSYVPLNQSQWLAQDALDLVEFANGNASTPFGSIRTAMGHAAPFGLNRLEVGNEERLYNPGALALAPACLVPCLAERSRSGERPSPSTWVLPQTITPATTSSSRTRSGAGTLTSRW